MESSSVHHPFRTSAPPDPPAARVLLVAGRGLVGTALEHLVETMDGTRLVGAVRSAEDALAAWHATRPDVVLLELGTAGTNPAWQIRELIRSRPDARVLALSGTGDLDLMIQAIDAGAVGAVLLESDAHDLRRAIREVARDRSPIDPRIARALLARPAEPAATQLSRREHQVLSLVVGGLSNKRIAAALGISEKTVKSHLGRVFRAIRVTDRTQAALWAVSNGIGPLTACEAPAG